MQIYTIATEWCLKCGNPSREPMFHSLREWITSTYRSPTQNWPPQSSLMYPGYGTWTKLIDRKRAAIPSGLWSFKTEIWRTELVESKAIKWLWTAGLTTSRNYTSFQCIAHWNYFPNCTQIHVPTHCGTYSIIKVNKRRLHTAVMTRPITSNH